MRIAVISDTHLPRRSKTLPKEVWQGIDGADLILHAGDVNTLEILEDLAHIAPVKAVLGNTDPYELAIKLPKKYLFNVGQYKIGLIHGDGLTGKTVERAYLAFEEEYPDIIVFGHSHQPYLAFHNKVLMFNPGSPTDKRFMPYYSYGILKIDGAIRAEIVYF